MAKIRIKTPPNFGKATERKFFSFLRKSESALEQIGKEYVREIQQNAKNPKTGRKYRALKQSTIENRKRIAKNNKTSSKYRPTFPNLTITGQFLDSFRGKIAKRGKLSRTLSIGPTGTHKGYTNKNGSRGKSVSNEVIAERMESLGRNVLSISKKKAAEIVEKFRSLLRQTL